MVLALFADSATNKLKVNQINRIFIMLLLLSGLASGCLALSMGSRFVLGSGGVEIPLVVSADER